MNNDPGTFSVAIDPSVHLRASLQCFKGVRATEETSAFSELVALSGTIRSKYQDTVIGQIPGIQNARMLFHAAGLDPTKRRPSSESLLRRALKSKELYPVNSLVDIGNWCSLDFLLPIGFYDLSKISGGVTVRIGTAEDSYSALNREVINFNGRYILCDSLGAFGSPMTDSVRASIDLSTAEAVFLIWAPDGYDHELLLQHSNTLAGRVTEYCGGTLEQFDLLI